MVFSRLNALVAAHPMRMFPLSTVLFPGGVLPLHVFEPRYLTMISEARAGDGNFGVVLIERGSEVGGGDTRFRVGTRAAIADVAELGGGRLAVVAVGEERFDIESWSPDSPYPEAMVTPRPERQPVPQLGMLVAGAARALRRVAGLASELGAEVSDLEATPDEDGPAVLWRLCAASPLEEIDRQRLLEIDDPHERAAALTAELDGVADVLAARLAGR